MTSASSPRLVPMQPPNRIHLLVLFILAPMLWNGYRLIEALVFWKTLREFNAQPGPWYLAISGFLWFTCGIVLLVGILKRQAWGWYATLGAVVGYTAWMWVDRLFLQQPHANLPFAILVTLVCLAIVTTILISRKAKRYFHLGKGNHEHE